MSSESERPEAELVAPATAEALDVMRDPASEAKPGDNRAFDLIEKGLEQGVGIENLERLCALALEMNEVSARQEFNAAVSRFQVKCPPVPKNRTGKITTDGGSSFSYKWADLDGIQPHIAPYLAAEGLSYTWSERWDGEYVYETCTLRHAAGHSESAEVRIKIEARSKAIGPQQVVGVSQTYGKRYSLGSVLGISFGDPDNDAAKGSRAVDEEATLSPEQIATIERQLGERDVDVEKFLELLKASRVEDIPASMFKIASAALAGKPRRDEAEEGGEG